MREIAAEQMEMKELCSQMWKETSELLSKYGKTNKDYASRVLLPIAMGAMILNNTLPLSPIQTLHKRTLEVMDDRILIFDLEPDDGSGVVLFQSKVDMDKAAWADIRIQGAYRFLRFTKNAGYIYALPEDPQYAFGMDPRLYEDPFKNNRGVLVYNLGIADIDRVNAYNNILQQVKQALAG